MKPVVIGIIGGIAPPSTIDYYQKIIAGFQERTGTQQYPSILLNSINMTYMLDLVSKKELAVLAEYLSSEIDKLKNAGADFAAMASNTPHIVFDEIKKMTTLPLVSIVEAASAEAKKARCTKLGLFGTKSTMQAGFYHAGFAKEGIEVVSPDSESQNYIHHVYMNEFIKGLFLEKTKKACIRIVQEMRNRLGIEGIILGGTELPFILKEEDFNDFILLNTTDIHVNKILEYALNTNKYGMN